MMFGTGKPSAEQDEFTAMPTNSSTLCGTVIKRGATKQEHYIAYSVTYDIQVLPYMVMLAELSPAVLLTTHSYNPPSVAATLPMFKILSVL